MDPLTVISVIVSIGITEALLSVDNALIVLSLTRELPEKDQKLARTLGIMVFGVGTRIGTLFIATKVIDCKPILYIGAIYLIGLAVYHLILKKKEEGTGKQRKAHSSLLVVVPIIAITDLIFSLDNVVVAIGLSTNVILVYVGVIIGIAVMFFALPLFNGLMGRYKSLESAAYLIVGILGFCMIIEHFFNFHIGEPVKLGGIALIILLTIAWEEVGKRRLRDLM
jgi:predicted tellurium resistance membrane protein TerC